MAMETSDFGTKKYFANRPLLTSAFSEAMHIVSNYMLNCIL